MNLVKKCDIYIRLLNVIVGCNLKVSGLAWLSCVLKVNTDLDNLQFPLWQVSFRVTCRASQAYSILACASTCLPADEPR